MPASGFSVADLEAIRRAVALAEAESAGEIVPYVVAASDPYPGAAWRGAAFGALLAALAAWAVHLWGGFWNGLDFFWMVLPPAGGGALAFVGVELVPALRRWLAGAELIELRTRQRAATAFIEQEVFHTSGRTGILLFLSQVGYGLEGKLTDLQSHRILDEVISPRFRQGDFDGGTKQGVDAIVKLLHGEPLPPRPAAQAAGPAAAAKMTARERVIFTLVFASVFVVVVGTFSVVAVVSRGSQSWFLYAFLTPFYIAFPAAVAGPEVAFVLAALWLIGFPILKHSLGRRGGFLSRARHHRGGFWGGFIGAASGGTGGGGSSGGGFSGGGGSFGGGGASGGW